MIENRPAAARSVPGAVKKKSNPGFASELLPLIIGIIGIALIFLGIALCLPIPLIAQLCTQLLGPVFGDASVLFCALASLVVGIACAGYSAASIALDENHKVVAQAAYADADNDESRPSSEIAEKASGHSNTLIFSKKPLDEIQERSLQSEAGSKSTNRQEDSTEESNNSPKNS
jgi:hypothetical protein